MNDKLSHLSEKQIQELIERYYSKKDRVKDLIKEYNIKTTPSQLCNLFPPKKTNEICPYCNINFVISYQSRDYYWGNKSSFCPICEHIEDTFCKCYNCQKKEQKRIQSERQSKIEFLQTVLHIDESNKIELDNLSFEEKVYLGAFLREGISEDYNYIKPIESFINPLAPTKDFTKEIIEILIEKEFIVIHPDSDTDCFNSIDYDTGRYSYYFYKVKWALNIYQEGVNKIPLIESLIMPTDINNSEEAYLLWKKISLYEVLEYFIYSVNNVLDVEYGIGEKTTSIFNDLLNDFSVSQIYTIIYRSVNNALRFRVEKDVSTKHAANTIIGSAQSFAERAKINGWNIQKYHRVKECPESVLSRFFFERILSIGYAGFDEKPHFINF